MEATIRLSIFLGIFAAVIAAEWRFPHHAPVQDRRTRWPINLSLLVIDVVAQRLTLGAAAFVTAIYAADHGWGLFNQLGWPPLLEGLIGFLLLDLAIYGQHVVSHAVPVFWRLHKVHHADLEVDATTAIRFHPLEILISLVWKSLIVLALGIDPWTVVIFEAVLNASAVYTHGNIALPPRLDHALRSVFCTPDMHRIHHSEIMVETNSNYGFFLSIWDRIFGTFRRDPERGSGLVIGLPDEKDPARLGLVSLLLMPFRRN